MKEMSDEQVFGAPAKKGEMSDADVFGSSATPPAEKPKAGFGGALVRGFKRSLPETKSLLYGATAAGAGLVGADGVRDWGLDNYQRIQRDEVEPLANQSGFIDSAKGKASFGEWAGDTLGNFGGQALQSMAISAAGAALGGAAGAPAVGAGAVPGAAVGGVLAGAGSLVARGAIKRGLQKEVASLVAEQAGKGVAREAAEAAGANLMRRRLAQIGGGAVAGTGLNVAQEVGIGYTGRADDAREAGVELTRGDALRAIGWGIPAGLVDSAAEGLAVGRLLKGGTDSSMVRRVLGGAAAGAVTEGGTEGVQAVMERAGAGQELTGAEAYTDYIENIAAGALGGSVPGAASGIRRNLQDDAAPGTQPPPADPASSDRPALPAPDGSPNYGVNLVTPDGTVITPEQQGIDPRVVGEPAPPVPNPAATPGPRVDASSLNQQRSAPSTLPDGSPLPDPSGGVLSRTVNMAAESGALGTPAPAGVSVSGVADGARALEPAMPSTPPPWVDAATGEQLRDPTLDDIKQLLHGYADNAMASSGKPNIGKATKAISQGYGLPLSTVRSMADEVREERKQGITAANYQTATAGVSTLGAESNTSPVSRAENAENLTRQTEQPAQAQGGVPLEGAAGTRPTPAPAPVMPTAGLKDEAAPAAVQPTNTEQPSVATATASSQGAASGSQEGTTQAFAPETGTLGIPRAEMPQVPTQSHGGLVKHLNAQGIAHETTMVDAGSLKPTQAEYSPEKVEQSRQATGDRAVIVSSDGHIIDGHHQAVAAAEDGKPVKAIVLDAPVEQALEAVKNSPSATMQADAAPATPQGAGNATASYPITEYTTGKGKVLRGTVRTDLTHEQAKAIDPFTMRHAGGQFIREKHFDALTAHLGGATGESLNELPSNPDTLVQESPAQKAGGTTAAKPPGRGESVQPAELIAVKDVYGKTVHVHKAALQGNGDMLLMYSAKGRPITRKLGGRHEAIVRDNLDADGSKRAQMPGLPYYAHTTKKGERPFKTRKQAETAVTDAGQRLDDYDIQPKGDGFVAVRKAKAAPKSDTAAGKSLNEQSGNSDTFVKESSAQGKERAGTFIKGAVEGKEESTTQVVVDNSENLNNNEGAGTTNFAEIDSKSVVAGKPAEQAPASHESKKPEPTGEDSQAVGSDKIDDFGERLEGARKFLPPSLKEELGEDAIATQPLSKFWPADAHESIENPELAALAFAARAEVPAKPRKPHLVARWVQQVKTLRGLPNLLESSGDGLADAEASAKKLGLRLDGFFTKVRVLAQLPRQTWKRVEKVAEYPNARVRRTEAELAAAGITINKETLAGNYTFSRYERNGKPLPPAEQDALLWKPNPFSSATIDGKTHTFEGAGEIGPDQMQAIRELLGEAAPTKGALTASDFEIRSYRHRQESFINRKSDAERRPLKTFTGDDDAKQARAYLKDNVDALAAEWEKVKARDNVGKADTRREQNRERVGEDRREGKDVTPEMFEQALGFRGVQFGNWVGQGRGAKDRQGLLNEAYDALLDLADLLGIPSRAISLNGTLGLSLGARGSGKASAHFEPGNLVINLTKTKGAGSLAHEWFHALDNYFARARGGEVPHTDHDAYRRNNYITYKPEAAWQLLRETARGTVVQAFKTSSQLRKELEKLPGYDSAKSLEENAKLAAKQGGYEWVRATHKDGVRPEVEAAFSELVEALNASPMAARARVLDGKASAKGDGYWHRIIERGARSFENYVISKLSARGWNNDFLANIRDWKQWEQLGKNAERYPYLKPEEEAPVIKAFDALFDTIQSREEPGGNVALFSQPAAVADSPAGAAGLPPARARALVRELTKNWGENRPAIRVAETPQEWAQALRDAGVQDAPGNARIEGMYDGSPVVWLNPAALATERRLAEVLAHEAIGHYGVENIVGRAQWAQITSAINRLRTSGTAAPSIQKALDEVMRGYVNRKEDGLDLNTAEGRETFAKEVIAVLAEQGVRNSFTSRVLAAVRRWLRQYMPSLKWTERDVLDLLGQADSFLRAGRTQAQQRELVQRYAFSSGAPSIDLTPAMRDAALAGQPLFSQNNPKGQDVRDLSPEQVELLRSLGLVSNEQADLLEDGSADAEARTAARRVLRDIAPTMTRAEVDAKLAALAQVKARLQDLKRAVTVPDIDGPMTPAMRGKITRLGYFLQGFAQDNPEAFDYGQAPKGEKDIQKIAEAMAPDDGRDPPIFTQGKTDAKGMQHWTIETANGRKGTFEVEPDGTLQLHIGDLLRNSGEGSFLYAVFNTWAARNGYKAAPDRAGLSEVNKYRRTASMLSSALREGNTRHLMPHETQSLPHWAAGSGKNNTTFNIGYMALREAKRVLDPKTAKLRIHLLDKVRYDFDQNLYVDSKGRAVSAGEYAAVLSQAAAGQGAVGRRSAQRAHLAATAWGEAERRGIATTGDAFAWGSRVVQAGAESRLRAAADPAGHAAGHPDALVLDGPLTARNIYYSRPADETPADAGVSASEGGHADTIRRAVSIDRAIIASTLGRGAKHPDYAAAKAGDREAGLRIAQLLVDDGLAQKVRAAIGSSNPVIVPVVSVEATGRNKIPRAAAEVLAQRLGLDTAEGITQVNSPKRTAMDGLDRIFAAPEFTGEVVDGQDYLLLDDTLTQGGTFAALASHIEAQGGRVVGAVALTGKQYSAKLALSPETLTALREKHGDIETDFRAATGYGFDALTESEARYLANYKPAAAVRDRILAERGRGRQGVDASATGQAQSGVTQNNQPAPPSAGPGHSGGALFSRAPEAEEGAARTPEEALDSIRGQMDKRPLSLSIQGGLTWLKKNIGLGLLPANYLADFAPKSIRRKVEEFMRIKRLMDSYRGEKHAASDEVSQKWLKLASTDRAGAEAFSTLAHESTLAHVDPSKEHSDPLQFVYGSKSWDATPENAAKVKKALKKEWKHRGGENKQPFFDRVNEIDGKVAAEKKRPDAHAKLRAQFLKLPPEWQALYAEVRDHYKDMTEEWDAIVLENIDKAENLALERAERDHEAVLERLRDQGVTGDELETAKKRAADRLKDQRGKLEQQRRARYAALKEVFESERTTGPYFPITRHGEFFSAIRDADGKLLSWSQFENAAERDWYVQQVKTKLPEAKNWQFKTGVMKNTDEVKGAVDAGFMVDIEGILTEASVPGTVKDAVWQRYLQTLPDFSIRKGFIHRKGTHGYQNDALRAFGSRMFHMAHQIAKLKYGSDLSQAVNQAREAASKSGEDTTDADLMVNELEKRADWMMNPTGSSVAQKITSFAFLWNLAISPAAAIVNWTQTPMIGIPVLGARLGGSARAARELLRASSELLKADKLSLTRYAGTGPDKASKWEHAASLSEDEKQAMEQFYLAGLLDRTNSHAMAGVGEQGVEYNATREKWMGRASFLFHHVERINRETTALAAYRLARQQGQAHQQAVDTSMSLTYRTHFDMSNSSRARLLTSDFAKVAMTHRAHSLNMTVMLFQNMRAMLGKAATKEEKATARKEFLGIMGTHAFMAGVTGVPFYGIALLVAGLFKDLLGDDDDEREPEDLLKKGLYDALPKWMADTVLYGAPSTSTGLSINNRVGFPDLFFRSPDRELDGKDEADYWIAQTLGPAWAIPPQMWTGVSQMRQGHFAQGMEKLTPKAVRDGLKAMRYGREGVLTLKGDPVVDSANAWNMIGQAAGFAPFKVSEAYAQRSAKLGLQDRINSRRSGLLNKYALAVTQNDGDGIREVVKEIAKFNHAYPEKPITTAGLRSSIAARQRRARNVVLGGVALDQKLEGRIERELGY